MTQSLLKDGCFSGAFFRPNCSRAGAKFMLIWCKMCAHLVLFWFKIVLVAGAKRGRLEVDVCVEDAS